MTPLTSPLSVRLLQIENGSRATLISPSHSISIRPIVRSLCIEFSVTWAWRTSVDDECLLVLTIQGSQTSGQHMYHNFLAKHSSPLLIIKTQKPLFFSHPVALPLSLSLCLCSVAASAMEERQFRRLSVLLDWSGLSTISFLSVIFTNQNSWTVHQRAAKTFLLSLHRQHISPMSACIK